MIWWLLGYSLGFLISLTVSYRYYYNSYFDRNEWFKYWFIAFLWPIISPFFTMVYAVRGLHLLLSRLER